MTLSFCGLASLVEASLIAHYGFEETTLTSGSSISDSLGSNNGTIEGGNLSSVTTGVFGSALNLAPAGYVDLGTGVQQTGDFTISFWVQSRVGVGNDGILGSANGIANGNSGFIIKSQDSGRLFFDSTTDGNLTTENNLFVDNPSPITDMSNVWNFLSVRFDSDPGTVQFTVSDSLANPLALQASDLNTSQNTNPTAGSNAFWNPNGFAIGAKNGAGGNEASFTIDDLRFYSTNLTDAELIIAGTTAVPEPSTIIFLLSGLFVLLFLERSRRKKDTAVENV